MVNNFAEAIDKYKTSKRVSLEYLSSISEIPLDTLKEIESGVEPSGELKLILRSFLEAPGVNV